MKGQTSLEYLLILTGTIMLVLLISTITKAAMTPGLAETQKNATFDLWPTPKEGDANVTSNTPTPSISPVGFFFQVQNSAGTSVASFMPTGTIIIKAGCYAGSTGSCANPPDDAFVIRDSTGVSHAFINASGSLCIEDSDCNYGDASCSSAPDGSFITTDTSDIGVSYISPTGALCLTGTLVQFGTP